MRKFILLLVVLSVCGLNAQQLYVKTFGDAKAKPLLFLHGGPGYNAASFEITTAQKLADRGFYVIVYDRRGEGRSIDPNAKFDFEQTFEDINNLYKKFKLKQLSLIGHSFGGVVATLYAERFPQNIGSVILVSAPVSLQQSFKTILDSSRKIYEANADKTNLGYLDMIAKMDPSGIEYASYTFLHAMQNGFYSPKTKTDAAKQISQQMAAHPDYKHGTAMTREAPMGFLKNAHYTTIDLTENLQNLVVKKMKIYGIYGNEDGLYSIAQIEQLEKIIGKSHLAYFDNCSHNVFIDQQELFLKTIEAYVK